MEIEENTNANINDENTTYHNILAHNLLEK